MFQRLPILQPLLTVYKKETTVFLWAFCVRLFVFLFLWWWFREAGHMPDIASQFPILSGDSNDYYILSQNLFNHHIFSSSISQPLIPESFRVPGYPFFLYIFYVLPQSLLFASLAQIALGSGSVLLLYMLGKKFLSEKAAWIGALLFSIEPTTLLVGSVVASDTLFVFAMLLGIYLLLSHPPSDKKGLVLAGLAGLLFGYAVLVRVIAQYLAVFLLFSYGVLYRAHLRPWRTPLLQVVLFVSGMVLVVFPWALRNQHIFHTYTISSTPYINVTQYNLVYFYAYQHHISPAEAQHIFADPIPYPPDSLWFRSLINESIFKAEIAQELHGNLFPYLKFHLVKTIPFFLNDSLREINRVTGFYPQAATSVASINFSDLILAKKWGAVAKFLLTPQPNLWMLLVGSGIWASITVLWLMALLYAVIKRTKTVWFVLFASGIIAYFAILSSPVIQPRYRMPAAPFMLLLAAESGVLLHQKIKNTLRACKNNTVNL